MNDKSKKNIKRIVIVVVSLMILPFLAYGILLLTIPISRSREEVRSYVLRNMPMGTSWNEALDIIDDKNWAIQYTHSDRGLIINYEADYAEFASPDDVTNSDRIKVGTKSMSIELGEFYAQFHNAVFAYLAFDEDNKLIEIHIEKYIDAP